MLPIILGTALGTEEFQDIGSGDSKPFQVPPYQIMMTKEHSPSQAVTWLNKYLDNIPTDLIDTLGHCLQGINCI